MFILKKLVSRLFFPLPLVVLLLLAGMVWKKRSKAMLLVAIAVLYLFSFNPFADMLMRPLERSYMPVSVNEVNKEVRWIVVLGGGSRAEDFLTPEDRLTDATLKRLLEGVRLIRLLPEAQLILSGGDYRGIASDALAMQQVAQAAGISQEKIILESASWDTADQARLLKNRLQDGSFYLVTSAVHMPRAVRMFVQVGTRPLPAPTDYRAVKSPINILTFFPSAGALAKTENAFYEYYGLAWGFVRGQI